MARQARHLLAQLCPSPRRHGSSLGREVDWALPSLRRRECLYRDWCGYFPHHEAWRLEVFGRGAAVPLHDGLAHYRRLHLLWMATSSSATASTLGLRYMSLYTCMIYTFMCVCVSVCEVSARSPCDSTCSRRRLRAPYAEFLLFGFVFVCFLLYEVSVFLFPLHQFSRNPERLSHYSLPS